MNCHKINKTIYMQTYAKVQMVKYFDKISKYSLVNEQMKALIFMGNWWESSRLPLY